MSTESAHDHKGHCAECRVTFSYRLIHNGFNDSNYAYCDRCGAVAILNLLKMPPEIPRSDYASIPKEAEPFLQSCSCGGKFVSNGSPRCPHCRDVLSAVSAADWIEANASGAAKGWRWQRNWSELYAIVIDGKVAFDPW